MSDSRAGEPKAISLTNASTSRTVVAIDTTAQPTAAQRVYDTNELFQRITDHLSVDEVFGLLVLEKGFLWRGIQWISSRLASERPARYTIKPDDGDDLADQADESVTAWYRRARRASVRSLKLRGLHSVFDLPAPTQTEVSPTKLDLHTLTVLQGRFPRLRDVEFELIASPPHQDLYPLDLYSWSHTSAACDWAKLHLPAQLFYISQTLRIPYDNLIDIAAPPTRGRLSHAWISKGYRAVYQIRLHLPRKAPNPTYLARAIVDIVEAGNIVSLEIDRFIATDQLLEALTDALGKRHGAGSSLKRLVLAGYPLNRKIGQTFTALLSACQLSVLDLCLTGSWPSSVIDSIVGIITPRTIVNWTHFDAMPQFEPSVTTSARVFISRPQGDMQIHLETVMDRIGLQSFTNLQKLSTSLRRLEIVTFICCDKLGRFYDSVDDQGQNLPHLVDLCKTELTALEQLTVILSVRPKMRCHEPIAHTPHPWIGTLKRLHCRIELEHADTIVPYFSMAKLLASLCGISTRITSEVVWVPDDDGTDLTDWLDGQWSFVEQDMEELIHWLVSLPPALQTSIRAADFEQLGLNIARRSLCSWRDIKFFEDEPIPLDIQNLADDYRRCLTTCDNPDDSEETQEAARKKRRIQYLFGDKQA